MISLLTSRTADPPTADDELNETTERPTLADVVSPDDIVADLPAGWSASITIVNTGSDLNEVLVITDPSHSRQYRLAPISAFQPTREIELSVRESRSDTRTTLGTASTLQKAVRTVADRAHTIADRRSASTGPAESTSRSSAAV